MRSCVYRLHRDVLFVIWNTARVYMLEVAILDKHFIHPLTRLQWVSSARLRMIAPKELVLAKVCHA